MREEIAIEFEQLLTVNTDKSMSGIVWNLLFVLMLTDRDARQGPCLGVRYDGNEDDVGRRSNSFNIIISQYDKL